MTTDGRLLPRPAGRPVSVLAYARTRTELDPVLASLAREIDPEAVWIELVDRASTGIAVDAADPTVAATFDRRFELEPVELLPEPGLANLARWVAGRPDGPSAWVDEAQDLAWLPGPLRALVSESRVSGEANSVVLARAERLVFRLSLGVEDAQRLLEVLARRGISLFAGVLVRPFPQFAQCFDYVVRVRRGEGGSLAARSIFIERGPKSLPG